MSTLNKTALKVLVSGDVEGKFNTLFSRVAAVNQKNGPFEMLICVGSFFGEDNREWNNYTTGFSKAPITTYILGPVKSEHEKYFKDPNGCELCHNITYLGKKGVLTGTTGLKIMYLSGIEGERNERYYFSAKDVEFLQSPFIDGSNQKSVDLLLTSQWPKGVTKYAVSPKDIDPNDKSSELIAKLAQLVCPRYHFAGMKSVHYERLPYRNHKVLAEIARHTTRFISLSSVSNAQKQKWLYAFSISPMKSMKASELCKQPPDVTECPYNFNEKEISATYTKESEVNRFFFDVSTSEENNGGRHKRHHEDNEYKKKKHLKSHPKAQGPCWFCLASPEVEKHLVVSVGDNNYVALAKGGLTSDHLLILPIGHYQSTVEMPDDALEEIEKFKTSLKKCFKTENKTVVFFERNYKSSHLQIQIVPVPAVIQSHLKEMFQSYADSKAIELMEIPKHTDLKEVLSPGMPYFYLELETGEKLFHRIKKNFPIQFGRELLAIPPVLNMPDRIDWKDCTISKEEEGRMAADFRKKFQDYDFTLA